MSEDEKKNKVKIHDNEVERKLDTLWNNWASRRKCESTHVPDFVRKKIKRIIN